MVPRMGLVEDVKVLSFNKAIFQRKLPQTAAHSLCLLRLSGIPERVLEWPVSAIEVQDPPIISFAFLLTMKGR